MTVCYVCNAPGKLLRAIIWGRFSHEIDAHALCSAALQAWDGEALATYRKAACESGYHRSPGQWTKDPADPYGDAAYWDCKFGCGYRQTHPGYGIGRSIAEAKAAHPEAFAGLEVAS